MKIHQMTKSWKLFDSIIGEINGTKRSQGLKMVNGLYCIVIEEKSMEWFERSEIVNITESIVLQMEWLVKLFVLVTLLVFEADEEVGFRHVDISLLIFLTLLAFHYYYYI